MLFTSFTSSWAAACVALLLAGPALAAPATTGHGGRQPARSHSSQATAAPVAPAPATVTPADTTTATSPAAPQMVQLKGLVLNPDGRPCAGASVFPAGAPRQLVVTDATGAFVLPVAAGAGLALQVEYFGVGSSRVVVDKPSAEPLRITLGH